MYKKYINKKGKKVGPYYYDSIRLKNGKIKSVYLGSDLKKAKKKLTLLKKEQSKKVHLRSSATLKKTLKHKSKRLNPRANYRRLKMHEMDFGERIALSGILILMLLTFVHFGGLLVEQQGMVVGKVVELTDGSSGNLVTGNVIFTSEETFLEHSESLDLIVEESGDYGLSFGGIDRINSMKISGDYALGDKGVVKVFLSDVDSSDSYLIFDSDSEKESKLDIFRGVTGFVVDAIDEVDAEFVEEIKYNEMYGAGLISGFAVVDNKGVELNYDLVYTENKTKVELVDKLVDEVVVDQSENGWFGYQEYSSRGLLEPENVSFKQVFGFDFSFWNVSNKSEISFTADSDGDYLYGCNFWDFEFGICLTDWIYLTEINNTQNYTSKLTRNVVAFAEGVFDPNKSIKEIIEVPIEIEKIEVPIEIDRFGEYLEENNFIDYLKLNFTDACRDTCNLIGIVGSNVKLKIYLKNAVLNLKEVKVETEENNVTDYSFELTNELGEVLIKSDNLIDKNLTGVKSVEIKPGQTEEVIQYGAVIGKPVKWKKKVLLNKSSRVEVEVPIEATNVTVKKVVAGVEEKVLAKLEVEEGVFETIGDTGKSSLLSGMFTGGNLLTGMAIGDLVEEVEEVEYVLDEEGHINETKTLVVEEEVEEIEIEYETPGPEAYVESIDDGKRILVTSETHYENILAFVDIPETDLAKIEFYRLVDGTRVVHAFDGYDTNDNGLVDYVEWVVPSLSNDTYEIVIEIVKAEHLDSNREFISDIFSEVRERDDVWSEKINHSDIVRVVFEENLTSINHIKMYIRNVDSSNTNVKVYSKNSSFLIGETPVISSTGYYKVFLSNMSGENDTFDLQVINTGSDRSTYLEFDHIIDPNEVPNVELASPANDTSFASGSSEVNLSVDILDDLLPLDNVTTLIFGGRDVDAANDDLLFIGNITNGSSADYSWRYQPFDIDSDTLIGYHFDGRDDMGETSTLVYDWAGNTNGTLKQQAFINGSNDIFGGHLELDGSGGSTADKVTCGTFPDIENENTDLSIMMWVRPDVSQSKFIFTQGAFQTVGSNKYYGYFVAQDGADLVVVHGNGETSVTGANSASATSFFTAIGEWVHIGIVRESDGSYEFFKDGTSFGTSTNTNAIYDTAANINIGDDENPNKPTGVNTNFNGGVDDLIVVNRSLTADEIANISKMGDATYYWYASGNDSTWKNTTAMNQFTIGVDNDPNADLNMPVNNSVYNSIGNIILNTTVSDPEGTNLTVKIYVTNGTEGVSLNSDDLVYYNGNVTDGFNVTYNVTAPILDLDDDYLLLAHFDNNPDYAENETLVYNFVGGDASNGTVKGTAEISREEGILAGALNASSATGSFTVFGNNHAWIGKKNISYVMWVNARDLSGDEGIFSKHTSVVGGDGFAINKNSESLKISIDGDINTVANFFTIDSWVHIAVVLNDTSAAVYQNGNYNQSFTYSSITENTKNVRIGASHVGLGITFNGLIDEFAVINRELSASEVNDTYRLKSGTHYWKVNVTDTAGNSNESLTYQFILDRPPTLSTVDIGPDSPNITVPLNCSFIPNDDLASTVDYTVKFFNESILDSTSTGTANTGSSFSITSPAYNHKHFDNWSCSVEITDDYDNSSGVTTTSALEILNLAPYPPSLLSPAADYSSTNTTVNFVWKPHNGSGQLQPSSYVGCSGFFCYENTSDLDSDNVTYLLNITCYDGGTVCDDTHFIEITENVTNCDSNSNDLFDNSDNCSYSKPLTYFGDDGVTYNWTVDVKDPYNQGSVEYGAGSMGSEFTITLNILAGMTMLNNTVNFNDLRVNTNNDTSACDLDTFSPNPCPLLIENAGNQRLNVNVTPPIDSFWDSVAYPHSIDYFSIKAGAGREGTAYTASGTNESYVDLVTAGSPQQLIKEFKYGNSNDEVRIDINITAPITETIGNKSSTLTFTGYYVPITPIPL